MSDFLSQEEINRLMGEEEPEPSGSSEPNISNQPTPYKLGQQERIVRGRLPAFELINERIARNLRLDLFNLLQKNVEISISPIKVQKYNDYIKNQVMPAALTIINVKPLRGAALITVDPQLLFGVVDAMFGGKGQFHTRVEGREFSETEQRILNRLLETIYKSSEQAWKSVFELNYETVRTEMQSQFINIATPTEPVITTSFDIELNGRTTSFNFCYPYSMLEPIKDLLSSNLQSESGVEDRHWKTFITKNLQDVEVDLNVELVNIELKIKDLFGLKNGDILYFKMPDQVHGYIEGKHVLDGVIGKQNEHNAVKIEKIIKDEPSI